MYIFYGLSHISTFWLDSVLNINGKRGLQVYHVEMRALVRQTTVVNDGGPSSMMVASRPFHMAALNIRTFCHQ